MTDPTRVTGWSQSTVQPGAVGGVEPVRRGGAGSRLDAELAYEAGVELKARSQWSYARMRFFRHKPAVVSLVILHPFALVAIFAKQIAPYGYDEIDLEQPDPSPGSRVADARGPAHLRDRPARPRLPEPDHLRHPHVALGRLLRRDPRDGHRNRRRRRLRLLRRPGRQPAHALHRPHPHASRASPSCSPPPSTSARDDSEVSLGRSRSTIPQPMKIGIILALPLLGRARARRARALPVAAREGVRRGGEGRRRERHAHHHAAHPPELRRADRRLHDADRRRRDPHRGVPLVRRATASSRRTPRSGSSSSTARARASPSGGSSCSRASPSSLIAMCINFVGDGLRDALDPTQRRSALAPCPSRSSRSAT